MLRRGETLIVRRYVEKTLEENKIFDTNGLVGDNESYRHRLRFWTVELCQQKPQTWDIVLAVSISQSRVITKSMCTKDRLWIPAWRRWHGFVCKLAVPARCPACSCLFTWLARVLDQVRL